MNQKIASIIAAATAATAVCSADVIKVVDENLANVSITANGYYEITGDVTLAAFDGPDRNHWILPSYVFVKDGATLTIEPGTIVRGEPGAGSGGATGTLGDAGHEPGTLIVTRTGQAVIEGTESSPIIFTSAARDTNGDGIADSLDYSGALSYAGFAIADFLDSDPINDPLGPAVQDVDGIVNGNFSTTDGTQEVTGFTEYQGLWGGIVILGNAPTSIGDISGDLIVDSNNSDFPFVVNPYEGQIEGLNNPQIGVDSIYGGRNPNDSSGSYAYISLRHGGYRLSGANEINGFTLGGVGFGTEFQYIEVYNNQDDAFEFFGGTVNTRYLISLFNNDDSFDMDEGFTGLGQFWFSMQNDDKDNGNATGEHDGTDANGEGVDFVMAATNSATSASSNLLGTGDAGGGLVFTFPTIYNATYVGSGEYGKPKKVNGTPTQLDDDANNIFTIRDSWGGAYFNSIFSDHTHEAFFIAKDGDERWNLGDIVFRSNVWWGNNTAYTASTFVDAVNEYDDGDTSMDAHDPSNAPLALQVFNSTGANFANNVVNTDPFAASNRVSGATANASYDGQIARRGWDDGFRAAHGGFDPSELNGSLSVTPEPYTSTFFIGVSYVGAFNPDADLAAAPNNGKIWTDNWTVFSDLYYENR